MIFWKTWTCLFVLAFLGVGAGSAQAPRDATPVEANEVVVLLHGLARSSWSMAQLEKRLTREGYVVVNLDYPSTDYPIEELADRVLAEALAACCQAATLHFVTHSMGGILVRYYLQSHALPNLGRVVMLSPPNQGSELVDVFQDNLLFQAINGPAGAELGTDPESLPMQLGPVTFPLGVITGNKSHNPVFSLLIPGPDDGKVAVRRAQVEGMQDFLILPYDHTFIMNERPVHRQVLHFLRYGRFDRSGTRG